MASTVSMGRRRFLRDAGAAGLAVAAGPMLWRRPAGAGAPGVEQVHLQFGADTAHEMVVSWATRTSVNRPKVRWGTPDGGLGSEIEAATETYRDARSGREIVLHHARLTGLEPASEYTYEAAHDGADPVPGSFRTAPRGRSPFRFTSFGDQGTAGSPLGSDASARVVEHVEQQEPLLHLVNGDLAYSDLFDDPAGAWDRWFAQNQPSASRRAWMPAAGNHEQEAGNGEAGYLAFQTRFALPDNGLDDLSGLFYAFTVGSVRFVVLQNDDVCYEWGTDEYVRGYSSGAQKAWLEGTLAEAAEDPSVDWIVVGMHQVIVSSALPVRGGGDLGIREEWGPLFDRYGVDLVLGGHQHCYERSHPLRGVDADSPTLRPAVVDRGTDVIDSSLGAVHLILGGGGSIPGNHYASDGPGAEAGVIVARGDKFVPVVEPEGLTWSAVTDPDQAHGFAAFDVDPGSPGGDTEITVTYYRTARAAGRPAQAYDRFSLVKPRRHTGAGDTGEGGSGSNLTPYLVGSAAVAGAAAASAAGVVGARRRRVTLPTDLPEDEQH